MSIGGGSKKVQETAAQKEQTRVALANYDRYVTKYRPARNDYIRRVDDNYASDTARALGTASGETDNAFGSVAKNTTAGLAKAGVGLGSGQSNFAATASLGNQAASRGLNLTSTRQAVEDTHRGQQRGIIDSAHGQVAGAVQGFNSLANLSQQQAEYDAQVSQDKAQGRGQLIGQGIGLAAGGLNSYFNRPPQQQSALGSYGLANSQFPGSDNFDG